MNTIKSYNRIMLIESGGDKMSRTKGSKNRVTASADFDAQLA